MARALRHVLPGFFFPDGGCQKDMNDARILRETLDASVTLVASDHLPTYLDRRRNHIISILPYLVSLHTPTMLATAYMLRLCNGG